MVQQSMFTSSPEKKQALIRKGIGGSSAGAIYNLGFGCRRAEHYRLTDTPPDFPKDITAEMERGTLLEPVIRELYQQYTGREVILRGLQSHPIQYFMTVNVDGEVRAKDKEGPGYFEAKCVNRFVFKKFLKEGIRDEYILQLNHGMEVCGYQWGSFGILCLDPWQFKWFDIQKDETICAQLVHDERIFWEQVQDRVPPERLVDSKDKRCSSCQWRRTCRAFELTQDAQVKQEDSLETCLELQPLVQEVVETKELAKEASDLASDAVDRLKAALGDRAGAIVSGYRALYTTSYPERWDTKALAQLLKSAKELIDKDAFDYSELESIYKDMKVILETLVKSKKQGGPERALRIYSTGD